MSLSAEGESNAMAKCVVAFPNWLDADPRFATVTYAEGGWMPELPLSNVGKPYFADLARSIDTALGSTRGLIGLGKRRGVRVGAIPFLPTAGHDCRIRLSGLDGASLSANRICDSGWSYLNPVVHPSSSIVYEHDSAWDGRVSAEEAAIHPMPWFHVFDSDEVAEHWLLEIDDTLSDKAYVEIPRLFLCPGIEPEINFIYGASIGYEDATQVEGNGVAEFFDIVEGRRVVRFTFDYQPDEFAVANWLDMQKRLGVHGDVFFIWNKADTVLKHRRSFQGRLRKLDPLEAVAFGQTKSTFEIIERKA